MPMALKQFFIIKTAQPTGLNWKLSSKNIVQTPLLGLPLDEENKEQQMTFIAKSFGRKLKKRFSIDVFFIDEYLSSSEAKNQLKWHYAHKNADRADVDKRSAELILQTWLNETTHD